MNTTSVISPDDRGGDGTARSTGRRSGQGSRASGSGGDSGQRRRSQEASGRGHVARGVRLRALEERVLARHCPGATQRRVATTVGSIHAVETGTGHPVVFLHGLGATLTGFAPLAAGLDARSLLVDLPGHGRSDPVDFTEHEPRGTLVAAVTEVIDELVGEQPVVLVGNSLGGMTALWVASARPGRTAGVALLGEPAFALPGARAVLPLHLVGLPGLGPLVLGAPPPPLRVYAAMMRRAYGRRALEAIDADVLDADRLAVRAGGHAASAAGLMRGIMRPDGRARDGVALSDDDRDRIDMPLWFLFGADDPFRSPDGERAVRRFPDARLDVVDGRHVPWLDAPELTTSRLVELMDRARW